jgi:hypothetical protein
MSVTETEVLKQWEPKVHKMLQASRIVGIEYEDQAQNLRAVIIKAWRKWDPERGVKFHTYVHRAMSNTIVNMIYAAQKNKNTYTNSETIEFTPATTDKPFDGIFDFPITLGVTASELLIMDLIVNGYKKWQIREICEDPKTFEIVYYQMRRRLKVLVKG